MGREINKLNSYTIANAKKWGTCSDGLGLYLQVSKWGTKSWVFRYMRLGERHQIGLGALHTVSLSEARARAREHRQTILDAVPSLLRRSPRQNRKRLRSARANTSRPRSLTKRCGVTSTASSGVSRWRIMRSRSSVICRSRRLTRRWY